MRGRAGGAGPLEAGPATCPEKGPPMSRNPLLRFAIAAVLVLGLLLPSAAAARGPVLPTASSPGWGILHGSLWDLFLQLLGQPPHRKNGWTIDPDGAAGAPGAPQGDNHGAIDPDGLKNRSQIDPNG
jgi:hypothetical protein